CAIRDIREREGVERLRWLPANVVEDLCFHYPYLLRGGGRGGESEQRSGKGIAPVGVDLETTLEAGRQFGGEARRQCVRQVAAIREPQGGPESERHRRTKAASSQLVPGIDLSRGVIELEEALEAALGKAYRRQGAGGQGEVVVGLVCV